jgi:hypothetical protein
MFRPPLLPLPPSPPKPPPGPTRRDRILACLRRGERRRDIARAERVTISYVGMIAQKAGIVPRPRPPNLYQR